MDAAGQLYGRQKADLLVGHDIPLSNVAGPENNSQAVKEVRPCGLTRNSRYCSLKPPS